MLINDFFSIENKTQVEENVVFAIKMHKNHKVYDGHFPSQPVAPGVCLAQMVKEICETEVGNELKMLEARNMKFMAVLNPFENEIVSVDLKIKEENDVFRIKAHCKNEEKSFFKIDAKYSK